MPCRLMVSWQHREDDRGRVFVFSATAAAISLNLFCNLASCLSYHFSRHLPPFPFIVLRFCYPVYSPVLICIYFPSGQMGCSHYEYLTIHLQNVTLIHLRRRALASSAAAERQQCILLLALPPVYLNLIWLITKTSLSSSMQLRLLCNCPCLDWVLRDKRCAAAAVDQQGDREQRIS